MTTTRNPSSSWRLGGIAALLVVCAAALAAIAPGAGAGNGADGTTYVLTSYDGVRFLGLNDQGRAITASFANVSTLRPAQLDKYFPNDPLRAACRPGAEAYNAAIAVGFGDGSSVASAIDQLVSNGCKAKVSLDTRALPPNPIRSFQPVP
jgi:hypothetical protein